MSRANYYKQRKVRQQQVIDEQLILDLVRHERKYQPHMGTRKLYHRIRRELNHAGVAIGRDRLFDLLGKHKLLIRRPHRSGPRTTYSRHRFNVYANLAEDLVLEGPNQLWVSDLTYIRTEEGFVYLAVLMDAWSRAILGYDCSDSLEAEGALRALQMAMKQRPGGIATMHHSDRGTQYCCHAYVEQLMAAKIAISMTEVNHCYENAKAERVHGTLKREYGLGATLRTKTDAYEMVEQAMVLYNHHRPHQALQYATPMEVHRGPMALAG